jgi:hypothetical protein
MPAHPKWPGLPYAELRLETKDERNRDRHWLTLTVKRDVKAGVWLATHATDEREEKQAVRLEVEELVHLARVLLYSTPNQWVSEIAFESPAIQPSPEADRSRARDEREGGRE